MTSSIDINAPENLYFKIEATLKAAGFSEEAAFRAAQEATYEIGSIHSGVYLRHIVRNFSVEDALIAADAAARKNGDAYLAAFAAAIADGASAKGAIKKALTATRTARYAINPNNMTYYIVKTPDGSRVDASGDALTAFRYTVTSL